MSLALFDLDNTLIAGDSDYLWGQFLVEKKLVDPKLYEQKNQQFYQQYQEGTLDIMEFLKFSLAPLSQYDMATLNTLHQEFMQNKIQSLWLPKAEALLEQHRNQQDHCVIITATNHFVTAPIARALGADDIIATLPEKKHNRFTGQVEGLPCFQEGKVQRLQQWLNDHPFTLDGSYFYSDSYNDLPLLQRVDHPVAVDPDPRLNDYAKEKGWPVMSLR